MDEEKLSPEDEKIYEYLGLTAQANIVRHFLNPKRKPMVAGEAEKLGEIVKAECEAAESKLDEVTEKLEMKMNTLEYIREYIDETKLARVEELLLKKHDMEEKRRAQVAAMATPQGQMLLKKKQRVAELKKELAARKVRKEKDVSDKAVPMDTR